MSSLASGNDSDEQSAATPEGLVTESTAVTPGRPEIKFSEEDYRQAVATDALYDAGEYLIAGLENQAEWWEHLGDAHRDYAALAKIATQHDRELARLRAAMRPVDREPTAATREERALELLVQASRTNPTLRDAIEEVEKWVRRLQEDRASAWQSYEEADVEAQYQMGQKLEAQQALWLIVKALDLNPAELPAGWGNSTKPILARIEVIVDEADRLARERDQAVAALERIEDVTHTARYPDGK